MDTATRRDLEDPATVRSVADAVGSQGTLELLHALTEADALATGPAAWSSWRGSLVADLVKRVAAVLAGDDLDEPEAAAPTAEQERLAALQEARREANEIINRAQRWVTAKVPYSMDQYWSDGYRQDCSGFV